MMDPFVCFNRWFAEERSRLRAGEPPAVCLSTLGTDGYPNSRFVALKEVVDGRFFITGPVDSRKGSEIGHCARVALCFWWAHTRRQVRVQGNATPVSQELADVYFSQRDRPSRIVSVISRQGRELDDPGALEALFRRRLSEANAEPIVRPNDWGGWAVEPVRIEFMDFEENRLHKRTLYVRAEGRWKASRLQP